MVVETDGCRLAVNQVTYIGKWLDSINDHHFGLLIQLAECALDRRDVRGSSPRLTTTLSLQGQKADRLATLQTSYIGLPFSTGPTLW